MSDEESEVTLEGWQISEEVLEIVLAEPPDMTITLGAQASEPVPAALAEPSPLALAAAWESMEPALTEPSPWTSVTIAGTSETMTWIDEVAHPAETNLDLDFYCWRQIVNFNDGAYRLIIPWGGEEEQGDWMFYTPEEAIEHRNEFIREEPGLYEEVIAWRLVHYLGHEMPVDPEDVATPVEDDF